MNVILLMVYILFILSSVFIFLDFTNIKNYYKRIILGGLCAFACGISAFRSGVGFDYYSYVDIYKCTPDFFSLLTDYQKMFTNGLDDIEVGYLLLNSVVKTFVDDFVLVFFAVSIFTFIVYYNAINKMGRFYFASFFIYLSTIFLYKEMGQIRHGIAMAIAFYSIYYLCEGKQIKFIILNVLAVCFHKAVFLIFILLFFKNFKWNKMKIVSGTILSIILIWVDVAGRLLDFFAGEFDHSRIYFAVKNMDLAGQVGIGKFIVPLAVIFISAFFVNKLEKNNKYFHIEISMLIIGLAIMSFFYDFKEFGQRLSAVFIMPIMFLIPQIFIEISDDSVLKYIGIISIAIICWGYFFHTMESFL